jgi:CheY-like chemotaxis protein
MKKIVIVEDQPDIRKLIRLTLEYDDTHEIHEAADGLAGLALIEAQAPDLVLMDVMMPGGLNGLEVCQRIKDNPRLAHTQVVLLTARGQDSDLAQGELVGADEYLIKPFSPLQLIDTVERLIGGE